MDIAGIKSTNLKFLFFFQLNKFTLCHFLFLNGSKTKNLKQTTKIGEWEKLHPNYRDDPELLNEWQNMLAGITENTSGNILKQKLSLKKKIASYIELKDAMAKENEEKD